MKKRSKFFLLSFLILFFIPQISAENNTTSLTDYWESFKNISNNYTTSMLGENVTDPVADFRSVISAGGKDATGITWFFVILLIALMFITHAFLRPALAGAGLSIAVFLICLFVLRIDHSTTTLLSMVAFGLGFLLALMTGWGGSSASSGFKKLVGIGFLILVILIGLLFFGYITI